MQQIKVLSVRRVSREAVSKIAAVDAAVQLTDAGGWYDCEVRGTWPAASINRFLSDNAQGHGSGEQRDPPAGRGASRARRPYPLELRKRAPRLKWFHQCETSCAAHRASQSASP